MRPFAFLLLSPILWGAAVSPDVIPANTLLTIPTGQTFLSFSVTQAEMDAPPVIGYLHRALMQVPGSYTAPLYYTDAQYVYETVFDAQNRIVYGGHPENVLFPDGALQGEVFETVVPRVPATYTLRLEALGGAAPEVAITTLRPFADPPGLPVDAPEPASWVMLVGGALLLGLRNSRSQPGRAPVPSR